MRKLLSFLPLERNLLGLLGAQWLSLRGTESVPGCGTRICTPAWKAGGRKERMKKTDRNLLTASSLQGPVSERTHTMPTCTVPPLPDPHTTHQTAFKATFEQFLTPSACYFS